MKPTTFTGPELDRYSRHLLLPGVGVEGQLRLRESSILIAGVGGLGSPAALYLAAAGVGHIAVLDRDCLERSNLQRQVLYDSNDIGSPKVEAAKERLLALNPTIEVEALHLDATDGDLSSTLCSFDLVLDGTDNFDTRYRLNDHCVALGVPLVYASISQFEGQASLLATPDGPCYRCLFPEPPPADLIPSCDEGGVLGVLPGLLGTIQATEALKWLLELGDSLAGRLLMVDALSMRFSEVRFAKDPQCPVCSRPSARVRPSESVRVETVAVPTITPGALAMRLDGNDPPLLLDVRTRSELPLRASNQLWIPLAELSMQLDALHVALESGRDLVIYCQRGIRSRTAAEIVLRSGVSSVFSLEGGLDAWHQSVGSGAQTPR